MAMRENFADHREVALNRVAEAMGIEVETVTAYRVKNGPLKTSREAAIELALSKKWEDIIRKWQIVSDDGRVNLETLTKHLAFRCIVPPEK